MRAMEGKTLNLTDLERVTTPASTEVGEQKTYKRTPDGMLKSSKLNPDTGEYIARVTIISSSRRTTTVEE